MTRTLSLASSLALILALGCGSDGPVTVYDAGPRRDSGTDAGTDAGEDSGTDAGADAGSGDSTCSGETYTVETFDRSTLIAPMVITTGGSRVAWLATEDGDGTVDESVVSAYSVLTSATVDASGVPAETFDLAPSTSELGNAVALGSTLLFTEEDHVSTRRIATIDFADASTSSFESTPVSEEDANVLGRANPTLVSWDGLTIALWSELDSELRAHISARPLGAESAPVTLYTAPEADATHLSFAAALNETTLGVAMVVTGESGPEVQLLHFDRDSLAPTETLSVATNDRLTGSVAMSWEEDYGILVWEEQELSGIKMLYARSLSERTADLVMAPSRNAVRITTPGERGTQPSIASHLGGFAVAYLSRAFTSESAGRDVKLAFFNPSDSQVEDRIVISEATEMASTVAVDTTEAGLLIAAWYDVSVDGTSAQSILKTVTVDCADLWLQCRPQ